MKRCPVCGTENNEDDRFCRKCGNDLSEAKIGIVNAKKQEADSYYEEAQSYFDAGDYGNTKSYVQKAKGIYNETGDFNAVSKCDALVSEIDEKLKGGRVTVAPATQYKGVRIIEKIISRPEQIVLFGLYSKNILLKLYTVGCIIWALFFLLVASAPAEGWSFIPNLIFYLIFTIPPFIPLYYLENKSREKVETVVTPIIIKIVNRVEQIVLTQPTIVKPIEKWKATGLIILHGIVHTISGLWSLFMILIILISFDPTDPSYNVYGSYLVFLTYIPFCLTTTMILYNLLLNEKLIEKYLYFNIFLCMFCILFCAFFWNLFPDTSSIGEAIINQGLILSIPVFVPNFISLLTIRFYGRELTIKGKEEGFKPPKPSTKTLPAELEQYYSDAEYIGGGGFAWVFGATRKDGEKVAIKIPERPDEKTGKLFIREVSNWSTLEHENIVKLYDFNVFPIPYLETELCDRSLKKCERLSIEKVVSIIFDVAKGLRYAHERRIIHGDIKPSNILTKEGRVKISDWGLSKVKSEGSVSLSGITPQYAAPEQISHEFGKADERTDIYQLGVVFYELVTEKLPFEGELSEIYDSILHGPPKLPSEINPDSKCIEHIIMKCLHKRKEERYQSVDELIKELENIDHRMEFLQLKKRAKLEEETTEEVVKYCPNCGNELDDDAIFCPKCGIKIKEG